MNHGPFEVNWTEPTVVAQHVARDWIIDGQPAPLSAVSGPIDVACGIARPEGFLSTLLRLGLEVRSFRAVGDHRPLGTLAPGTVVTEKDAARLPPDAPVRVLRMDLEVDGAGRSSQRSVVCCDLRMDLVLALPDPQGNRDLQLRARVPGTRSTRAAPNGSRDHRRLSRAAVGSARRRARRIDRGRGWPRAGGAPRRVGPRARERRRGVPDHDLREAPANRIAAWIVERLRRRVPGPSCFLRTTR